MTEAGSEPPNMEDLVRRAQQKDEQAFAVLYTTYLHQINMFLHKKMNNDHMARDLAQDTLFKAWRNLASLKEPAAFKSWLYQIANHSFLDLQKRRKKIATVDIASCQENTYHLQVEGPEDGYISKELFYEALDLMKPKHRDCLLLYVHENKSKAEIADMLGIKENSVDKYLSRARQELRSIYALIVEREKDQ
ncbi:RNA polymerase sigma factor YlaC [Dictyobacter alpinus]|uniref:RNA polymerase sigma factor YlaC n=1 Tax=Dictyobacter alpinus TaxID=2014873 RepID=A0A402BC14_9CHLR|nr:RNA polymerase sigma factor [Dictyobacter alpinus]GCE28874.1 RNA polymerase sigma factor YlaC [Dictyobacter alpinus]